MIRIILLFAHPFLIFLLLTTVTSKAQTIVQGNVSGTWAKSASPYIVIGDVTIPSGQTLTIEPGVVVKIGLGLNLIVNGKLIAIGNQTDKIFFTTTEANPAPGQWGKIIVVDTATINYCVVQYGNVGIEMSTTSSTLVVANSNINNNTIGLSLKGPNVKITNSLITKNKENGIYAYGTTDQTIIDSCKIFDNNKHGIYLESGNLTIKNCTISNNYYDGIRLIYSSITVRGCIITNNKLYGLGLSGSNIIIINSQVSGNIRGINCYYLLSTIIVDSCVINSNISEGISGYENGGAKMTLRNNLIYSNGGSGITNVGSYSTIENNTIVKNASGIHIISNTNVLIRNNIISNNTNIGLQSTVSPPPTVKFNDIYGNATNFSGFSSFYGDTSLGIRNRNGDKCDPFSNIVLNPLFVNLATDNYHLQPTSPCINAGDSLSNFDPDSTYADIGAFYYNLTTSVNNSNEAISRAVVLQQNYPNPFNLTTTIPFSLPASSHITLTIYNCLGQEVEKLVNEEFSAGDHEIKWNARGYPSGIYLYRLQAGSFVRTRKLILLK